MTQSPEQEQANLSTLVEYVEELKHIDGLDVAKLDAIIARMQSTSQPKQPTA